MSDGKEHIVLLGDTHEAAKWVGWGKARLRTLRATNQLARNYRPVRNVLVRIERWGGVEKVIIDAEVPPGPAFVGFPYDTCSFVGYGWDPDDPVGPEFSIGDPNVLQNRAVLIKAGPNGAHRVERYPQYADKYGGMPAWGNNVWTGGFGPAALTFSWKGLQSRHPQSLLINQELYAGFNCQDQGFAYIGTQLTDGKMCLQPASEWYNQDPYVCVGLPWGSSNTIGGGNILEEMFGQYVYRDGQRFYNAGSGATILGAAARVINADSTYLPPSWQFLCIVAERDPAAGVYKEYLYVAPLNDVKNGESYKIAEYKNTVDDGLRYISPETNCMSWNFSSSGNFAVTMRNFYNFNPDYYERCALKLDVDALIEEGGVEYTPEQLWNSHFDAPHANETGNEISFSGENVLTVDVDGEEIVYAYIDQDFYRTLYVSPTGVLTAYTETTEYLRFSKFPDDRILLQDFSYYNYWYGTSAARDYCYRDVIAVSNTINDVGCIDARYGILTTWEQKVTPYREHQKNLGPVALSYECLPYPVPTAEQVKTYVAGKLIEEKPVVNWDDYNFYIDHDAEICPLGVGTVVFLFNPIVGVDYKTHPFTTYFFGAYTSSVIAANIDETVADIVLSFKAYNNGFGSTNMLIRMNRITGEIILKRDLDKLLQIGAHHPEYGDGKACAELPIEPEGTYAYVGLI